MSATLRLAPDLRQDLVNIATGLFAPLTGFMTEKQYRGTVNDMRLPDGSAWTIPVTLDVEEETARQLRHELLLTDGDRPVARLAVTDCFRVQPGDLRAVFGTEDEAHPGVRWERRRSPWRVGGEVELLDPALLEGALQPVETMRCFRERGWESVAGFQTRNPVHTAHEHLQRTALELCDGLLLNPLTGWKKSGDFSEEAVRAGYRAMLETYYPAGRVHFAELRTPMRYAGPREAVFHALVRRNLGCTHFIIGRDHAGVGDYYAQYAAHELAAKLQREGDGLGIELLLMREPYWCERCAQIVSDRTCDHYATHRVAVSATLIRQMLAQGKRPDPRFMRAEVADAIIALGNGMFITEEED